MVPDPEAGSTAASVAAESDADGGGLVSRQTLVRIVIVLGIGIPIVVEGLTFIGLVGEHVGDDGDVDGTDGQAADGVTVGDDLLPSTEQQETLRAAQITAQEGWTLTLAVDVNNTGSDGYSLRLGAVETPGGRTVAGGVSTGSLAAGVSTTLTGTWDLPAGETVETLAVRATVPGPDGPETVTRVVRLEKVPVSG